MIQEEQQEEKYDEEEDGEWIASLVSSFSFSNNYKEYINKKKKTARRPMSARFAHARNIVVKQKCSRHRNVIQLPTEWLRNSSP